MRVDGERLESRRSPQWVSHLANDKAKNGETMHTIEWHGRATLFVRVLSDGCKATGSAFTTA